MVVGQSSFRRILLSRLLLVSVPVLLIGVYVTYRKARSAFLETARQNLTESAIRKADQLSRTVNSLQGTMSVASDSITLKEGNRADRERFLKELRSRFPNYVNCIGLVGMEERSSIVTGECRDLKSLETGVRGWLRNKSALKNAPEPILVENMLISHDNDHQLYLRFTIPIRDDRGKVKYGLVLTASLLERERILPGSLAGYPVVIDQNGIILSHPFVDRIGRDIDREVDARRLNILIDNAIRGRQDFLHLFSFERDGNELVAGYSAIYSPITGENGKKWVVLAVSPVSAVLSPLSQIWEAVFYLVAGLIIAYLGTIVLIARELGRPLEKLRDYALNIDNINFQEQVPRNFTIREIDQLSMAIEQMIDRLRAWGDEVMTSWKEAQNANRLKNEFLATTSHELRTPLNGIIGCIRCVRDGFCDSEEEKQEFLEQADRAAVHLLGIINDILDLSKIESGKLSVNLEPIDLEETIEEVVNLQLVHFQTKGLTLNWHKKGEGWMIYADSAKFKQILLNLISNSIKFTEKGRVTIDCSVEKEMAIVRVTDTGIGIPPHQQSLLFRPFVMIDGSRTRRFSGTGLGLAISKNLVEIMGGNIGLYSRGSNLGTTVTIRIPLFKENLHKLDKNHRLQVK